MSAIVAAAPAIEADDEEIAYSVGVITVFGIAAMLAYPYLAFRIFGGDPVKSGLFLGTAIHETAQVAGAAVLFADTFALPRGLEVATVAKLVRNVLMAVVIPAMALRYARQSTDPAKPGAEASTFTQLFPVFILGFLGMAVIRSIGDASLAGGGRALGLWDQNAWAAAVGGIKEWAVNLMVVALAGVGLSTRLSALRKLGAKPLVVGLGAALMVGVVSAAAILLLGSTLGL